MSDPVRRRSLQPMPYIDRDGVSIFYEVREPAQGNATDEPPLLLTHGYAATSEMWNPNLDALAQTRRVVTWDIRGHGKSDSPSDPDQYSEALSVEDMSVVLDASGIERAVIGGLSLGGYLSMAFHLTHPQRVVALLLCDTGPGYRKAEPRESWNETSRGRAVQFEKEGLTAAGRSREVLVANHRSAAGLALAARGILTQHDSRVIDSLPEIGVPTLIVVGSEDKPFLTPTDVMAAKIPGARKAVIEGAGHASNIDQPEAFDRVVIEFLSSLGPR